MELIFHTGKNTPSTGRICAADPVSHLSVGPVGEAEILISGWPYTSLTERYIQEDHEFD